MLTVTVPKVEVFDEEANKFYVLPEITFDLEHSLVSLSKWESFWEKPFLSTDKNDVETLSYVKLMTISPGIPDDVYERLSAENISQIQKYIEAKMTATWFKEESRKPGPSAEIVTAEVIYHWMVSYQIPFECQYWHLNRLLALVKVCNAKAEKPKKRSTAEIVDERRRLNAERRAEANSTG